MVGSFSKPCIQFGRIFQRRFNPTVSKMELIKMINSQLLLKYSISFQIIRIARQHNGEKVLKLAKYDKENYLNKRNVKNDMSGYSIFLLVRYTIIDCFVNKATTNIFFTSLRRFL